MADHNDAYDPPIPTYDEAMASSPRVMFESVSPGASASLLRNPGASSSGSSSRRHPLGYRAPTVESDNSDDDDDSDDDHFFDPSQQADPDDRHETNMVRREMEEFEMDDGDEGRRSLFGKRIPFSLPAWRWRWKWRMPRLRIRLPAAADTASQPPQSSSSSNQETSSSPPSPSTARAAAAAAMLRGVLQPNTQLVFLVARLIALGFVFIFFYVIFSGSLIPLGRMGMQPSPEAVRNYLLESIDPRRLRASVQHFSAYAHLAGTEGGYAMAKDVETMFRRAGLQGVGLDEYHVHLNYPLEGGRSIQILDSDGTPTWDAHMEEEDPGTETAGRLTLAFHALSKDGMAEGNLVYANFGTRQDFAKLAEMGVDTAGAVALVRYGVPPTDGTTRVNVGLKVKAAEEAGFAACVVYSDPADDGFRKGPVAPAGPYMPADGVHRASVGLHNWVLGDVLTPGWESKKGLPRMDTNHTRGLVQIPSIPIAWRDAQVLLQRLDGVGKKVPKDWVGGVPDVKEWWTGGGGQKTLRVRVRNLQDEMSQKTIINVHGRIEGYEQGGKSVIIGNARDTLAFGATDPHSGTAVLIELARLLGGLAERGWQPLRTIEFASWDGEAYNTIGSTEFVERRAKELRRDAVAYINVAAAVAGSEFHASGSPSFSSLLSHVLRHVGDPNHDNSLQALWERRGARIEVPAVGDGAHVPFLMIGGTSSLNVGFQGDAWPRASGYDDFDFVDEIGDPGWVYHTLIAQVVGLLAVELADRHVLPLELDEYGDLIEGWAIQLQTWVEEHVVGDADSATAMHREAVRRGLGVLAEVAGRARERMRKVGEWTSAWQRTMLASGWVEAQAVRDERLQYNAVMSVFEAALLDTALEGGYPNRTQFKHILYGPRAWSTTPEQFPGIRDAVEAGDWALAERLLARTLEVLEAAITQLGLFRPSAVQ